MCHNVIKKVMVQTTNALTWNLKCGSLVYLWIVQKGENNKHLQVKVAIDDKNLLQIF
jgi:hypothetical protein